MELAQPEAYDAKYSKALIQKGSSTKNDENEQALPAVSVGDERKVLGYEIKEGKTSPPKHFTEVQNVWCHSIKADREITE